MLKLLKNPYFVWKERPVREKQRLFYFLFDSKLAYSSGEGYRTPETSSVARVFEEFVDSDMVSVDLDRKTSNSIMEFLKRFWFFCEAHPEVSELLRSENSGEHQEAA